MTPYQLASLWSEIDDCGYKLRNLNIKTQDSKEFYKLMDRLLDLQNKLKAHEEANECK